MQAAKARGQVFGNPNGARALRGLGNDAGVAAVKAAADRHAQEVAPIVHDIQASGATTLLGIAGELNARGILTSRRGKWHATTVKRVLEKLDA